MPVCTHRFKWIWQRDHYFVSLQVYLQLFRPPVKENPSLSFRARESTRDLADFCQILYCGGVPKLSGTFQHWLKSVKNDTTLRLTCFCAHLERKFVHSCQSHECHKNHREKMIYESCTQYIFYISVVVFAVTFASLYVQYGSSTY